MQTTTWLSVLIGVIGAVLGVYLRESYRRALKQQTIAAQVTAHVLSWQMTLHKLGLGGIAELSRDRHQEKTEALATGGKELFVRAYKKHAAKVEELKSSITQCPPQVQAQIEQMHRRLHQIGDEEFKFAMTESTAARADLLAGRTFVTDVDAAELGAAAAYHAVAFKTEMCALLQQIQSLSYALRGTVHFDMTSHLQPAAGVVEHLVGASDAMHALEQIAGRQSARSLLRQTLRNMGLNA